MNQLMVNQEQQELDQQELGDFTRQVARNVENLDSEGFFSDEPMTDEAFAAFVVIENDEVPIEEVDFSKPLRTVFEI